ncbi:DNA primase [Streptomyces sp. BYX5S]
MNRATLGLAVGAGYLLGRTKKLKLAFAVGTMVAGKKLQLSPKAVLDLVRTQLDNNPQFKELGGQLREDFRGVGKAATGAILERQIEGLAGRLQNSTAGIRDRIDGVAPVEDVADKATGGVSGKVTGRATRDRDDDGGADEHSGGSSDDNGAQDKGSSQDAERPAPRKRAPAKKSTGSGGSGGSGARGAAPRKSGQRAQGAAKKASTPAKKATGAARRAPRGDARGERGHG